MQIVASRRPLLQYGGQAITLESGSAQLGNLMGVEEFASHTTSETNYFCDGFWHKDDEMTLFREFSTPACRIVAALVLPVVLLAVAPMPVAAGQQPADQTPVPKSETGAKTQATGTAVRQKVTIPSTVDGTDQPCYVTVAADFSPNQPAVPLLISLHSWSGDVEQRSREQQVLETMAIQRGWIHLFPHFRGPNRHPDACGSAKAQQDILDAVTWARSQYPIDPRRIYLTGSSGGGHMTMLMAGRHPDIWAAASAWVGISDLAAWHQQHASDGYGAMLRASCGGAPGDEPNVDQQYRERSPLSYLARATDVPLDIAAGIHDGHSGSVPIRHSLAAFNEIARAVGGEPVSDEEIRQLSRPDGRLDRPRPSDQVVDPILGRDVFLRRRAGKSRVTIFEGGHEGIPGSAISWLEKHSRSQ